MGLSTFVCAKTFLPIPASDRSPLGAAELRVVDRETGKVTAYRGFHDGGGRLVNFRSDLGPVGYVNIFDKIGHDLSGGYLLARRFAGDVPDDFAGVGMYCVEGDPDDCLEAYLVARGSLPSPRTLSTVLDYVGLREASFEDEDRDFHLLPIVNPAVLDTLVAWQENLEAEIPELGIQVVKITNKRKATNVVFEFTAPDGVSIQEKMDFSASAVETAEWLRSALEVAADRKRKRSPVPVTPPRP